MNIKDKQLLDSLGVFMNSNIKKKYGHKHTDPDSWCRFYYYKNRKPFAVPNSNIRYDAEVTSTNTLHKFTFYKMLHLSNSDLFYDFYYKLKEDIPSDIILKKIKNKVGFPSKNNVFISDYKHTPPEVNANGQIIVSFD